MRPSATSFSRVMRAISRRTGSNDANRNRLGSVIDDEIDPGDRLESADIATLPADDPALSCRRREG